jgi:fumarate hydratase class II
MTEVRIETDSLGVVEVPADKLWGAQTQRSFRSRFHPSAQLLLSDNDFAVGATSLAPSEMPIDSHRT